MTNQHNENTLSTKETLWELATRSQEEWLSFSRRLIQTPSLPGQEAEVAEIIQEEMRRLDYDRVWTDKVGNVNGKM